MPEPRAWPDWAALDDDQLLPWVVDPRAAAALDGACARDTALADRVHTLRTTAEHVRAALLTVDEPATTAEVTDEALALYLDDALPPDVRAALEEQIADSAPARARLVALYRTVQRYRSGEGVPATVAQRPAGQQLDWAIARAEQKRRAKVRESWSQQGASEVDGEGRKRRISPGSD